MGISPDQFKQMEQRLEKTHSKSKAPPPAPTMPPPEMADLIMIRQEGYWIKEFTHLGEPIGKPRMTRRDQFRSRPATDKYWAFKDAIKQTAGVLPENPDIIIVTAWCAMPPSWSAKKMREMVGKPCRTVPDWDNIAKAVCDSLFGQDSCIWGGATFKYWCYQGQQKLNVKIFYAKTS
jgi:hypothetical protein